MIDSMKVWVIQSLITALIARMDEPTLKAWADAGLDKLEELIVNSETNLDDKMALPLIQQIREAFGIDDDASLHLQR
jgi:hypothetical protein